MTFDEWIDFGIRAGYCSEQFCETHDGGPSTEKEMAVWEAGEDPCVHMIRLGSPVDWDRDLGEIDE